MAFPQQNPLRKRQAGRENLMHRYWRNSRSNREDKPSSQKAPLASNFGNVDTNEKAENFLLLQPTDLAMQLLDLGSKGMKSWRNRKVGNEFCSEEYAMKNSIDLKTIFTMKKLMEMVGRRDLGEREHIATSGISSDKTVH